MGPGTTTLATTEEEPTNTATTMEPPKTTENSLTTSPGDGNNDAKISFLQHYDTHTCLQDKSEQDLSKWEALTQLTQEIWTGEFA